MCQKRTSSDALTTACSNSSQLPISRVVAAAGLDNQGQPNAELKKHNGLVPSNTQRRQPGGRCADSVELEMAYKPPFAWDRILAFLGMRAIPGVEAVADGAYMRSVRIASDSGEEFTGWITVRPDMAKDQAIVTVSASLLDVLPQVICRIRHQFDLDCDPKAIASGLEGFAERFPQSFVAGTRLPGCFDAFEMCVRAVLGQQISVKGASTLAGRVAEALGQPVDTPFAELRFTFPSAADIVALGEGAQEALGSLGIVGARCRTIRRLAEELESGRLDLSYGADPEITACALEALPGIGPWTAQYIVMRATGYPDAFPSTDLGVKKALDPMSKREIEEVAEGWRPWRSYATMSLWSAPH